MRNQIKEANQINSLSSPLCVFSGIQRNSLSEKGGKPSRNSTLEFTEYTFRCFLFKCRTTVSIAVLHQIPTSSPGLQKIFHRCCSFFIWTPGTQANCVPNSVPSTGPCVSDSTTQDKWSDPEVNFGHLTVGSP